MIAHIEMEPGEVVDVLLAGVGSLRIRKVLHQKGNRLLLVDESARIPQRCSCLEASWPNSRFPDSGHANSIAQWRASSSRTSACSPRPSRYSTSASAFASRISSRRRSGPPETDANNGRARSHHLRAVRSELTVRFKAYAFERSHIVETRDAASFARSSAARRCRIARSCGLSVGRLWASAPVAARSRMVSFALRASPPRCRHKAAMCW